MITLPETISEWRVLIVDDHIDNLEVARAALVFHGAEVHAAENGREGLTVLDQVQPNLVLLDLSMPVMDGWAMFKEIRADHHWDSVPVIALTAHAMTGDRERVLEAGFDGYIPKPFDVVSFVKNIQRVLFN